MRAAALFVVAALLGGCATVDRMEGSGCAPASDGMTPVETVQVMNSGWLLLSCIPVASGNPESPNRVSCRVFRDTTTLQNQLDMLEAEARRVGATRAVNVTTSYTNERVFLFLLKREKILTSATLVKQAAAGE